MNTQLNITDFQRMIAAAFETLKSKSEELSKLDAVLGDGDHGEAIVNAFTVIEKCSHKGENFKAMLDGMGFGVMLETSGSTSTLLGAFLLGMSEGAPANSVVDVNELKTMFRAGVVGIRKNTRAGLGDKTMMDAVIPAVQAMENSSTDDVGSLFKAAAEAAIKGAEETKNMKANFGRARNLGDKTIGHIDAGATSWALIFQSFALKCEC